MRWARDVARMQQMRATYKKFNPGTLSGRCYLEDRLSCQECTKMDRRGIGCGGLEWINLAADKF
jgi:hypothetical protein